MARNARMGKALSRGRSGGTCGSLERFDGDGVDALGNEKVQCIIHKAMARDARLPFEQWGRDTHPEVRAIALGAGTGMAGMRSAFVDHFQVRGLQPVTQHGVQVGGVRQDHAAGLSSDLRWGEMYRPCASRKTMGKAYPQSLKLTQASVLKYIATYALMADMKRQ